MKILITKATLLAALVLLAGLGSPPSWAAVTCSQSTSTVFVDMPEPIFAPRDATPGTPLTSWLTTEASQDWYNCTVSEGAGSGTGLRSLLPSSGQTKVVEGITYDVQATGVDGLGVIISARTFANGCGWSTVQALTQSWKARGCNSQGAVTNGGQFRVMFVKTGAIAYGGLPSTPLAMARATFYPAGGSSSLYPGLEIKLIVMAALLLPKACSTPDVSVFLKSPKVSVFSGKDSSSRVVAFDIALNGCPSGLSAIHYQIDAATPILDNANAIISLDASSSATGVGIQLLDGDGNPAILGTKQPFTGYTAATGGNFKIPLGARYRQTGDSVTPGSANSAVTFTMSYL